MAATRSIVLLHGLGRTARSMRRLAAHAARRGYAHVHNVGYPTRGAGVWTHAERVGRRLAALAEGGDAAVPFDVVTHSLGGIVLRAAVAGGWLPATAIARAVMIAPPNGGSELADVLVRRAGPLFRLAVGPAGAELRTGVSGVPAALPPVPFETGVIAGTRGLVGAPRPLRVFAGPHDGKVSVELAAVAGMRDFLTVRRGHTFVMDAPEVIEQVFHFLAHGAFAPPPPRRRLRAPDESPYRSRPRSARAMAATSSSRFAPELIDAFARAKILGVCAGRTHRFTGVWVVVVGRRVFVRSWGDSPTGWYRAMRASPDDCSVSLDGEELRVVARHVRSARLRAAVSAALAEKYPTPGSVKWVRGFAEPAREANTLELLPTTSSPPA